MTGTAGGRTDSSARCGITSRIQLTERRPQTVGNSVCLRIRQLDSPKITLDIKYQDSRSNGLCRTPGGKAGGKELPCVYGRRPCVISLLRTEARNARLRLISTSSIPHNHAGKVSQHLGSNHKISSRQQVMSTLGMYLAVADGN